MPSTTQLKIAIVGAGPVGLSLAAILHHHGIKSVIFDRDTSATARSQGGTLDIHADAGQRALIAAGLRMFTLNPPFLFCSFSLQAPFKKLESPPVSQIRRSHI